METMTLNNAVEMPVVGLGVFRVEDHDELVEAITHAIVSGYRSIDTAAIYGNEEAVGEGIRKGLAATGLKREDLFITSKIWNEDMRQGNVVGAYEESLRKMQLDYLDLYLIHWPVADKYVDTWLGMEQLYKEDKVRSIGVSNFQVSHLEALAKVSSVTPVINQVEYHPMLIQTELKAYLDAHNIQMESWSPLMNGEILTNPVMLKLAEKYDKSVAQLIIRWNIQTNVITIPKSTNKGRLIENLDVFDFQIDSADIELINGLNEDRRVGPDPDNFNF